MNKFNLKTIHICKTWSFESILQRPNVFLGWKQNKGFQPTEPSMNEALLMCTLSINSNCYAFDIPHFSFVSGSISSKSKVFYVVLTFLLSTHFTLIGVLIWKRKLCKLSWCWISIATFKNAHICHCQSVTEDMYLDVTNISFQL